MIVSMPWSNGKASVCQMKWKKETFLLLPWFSLLCNISLSMTFLLVLYFSICLCCLILDFILCLNDWAARGEKSHSQNLFFPSVSSIQGRRWKGNDCFILVLCTSVHRSCMSCSFLLLMLLYHRQRRLRDEISVCTWHTTWFDFLRLWSNINIESVNLLWPPLFIRLSLCVSLSPSLSSSPESTPGEEQFSRLNRSSLIVLWVTSEWYQAFFPFTDHGRRFRKKIKTKEEGLHQAGKGMNLLDKTKRNTEKIQEEVVIEGHVVCLE